MMLRKRTRSDQKDQAMSVSLDSKSNLLGIEKLKTSPNSLFTVPGLFIGLINNGLADSDSVKSPTSPLELRNCSNSTEPLIRSARSSQNGHQLNMGSSKVGLSIVDSLADDMNFSGEVIFGPAMRIKYPKAQTTCTKFFLEPKPLPKDCPVFPQTETKDSLDTGFPQTRTKDTLETGKPGVVFEIGDNQSEPEPFGFRHWSCSLDSCRSFSSGTGLAHCKTSLSFAREIPNSKDTASTVSSPSELAREIPNSNIFSDKQLKFITGSIMSSNGSVDSFSASEIEHSEDYTCVISRGPNPKTTHIYGDRILECHDNEFSGSSNKEGNQIVTLPTVTKPVAVFPSDNFLGFCYFCNKKLEEGKDIYIYRGEKAFCSAECRSEEILRNEETEEAMDKSSKNSDKSNNGQEIFKAGIVFTT